MNDHLSKAQVIALLKSQHKISTTRKTLNRLLPYMGLADKKKFSDADVENIIKAREILKKNGNGDNGYIKVAEEFGVNPNTISISPQSSSSNDDDSEDEEEEFFFSDIADQMIENEFHATLERRAEHFMTSKKPHQMLLNIIKSKRDLLFQTLDGYKGTNIRQIEQVSNGNQTIDIPVQEVSEAPPEEDEDRNIADADFHNQDGSDNGGQQ